MFDIIIIGGGHAGVEAAYISSQFNLKIAILTLPNVPLASAPCNPSIGGVGKGQVVKEIDALGGLCGKLADLSGIQFRTLNESKGYAVQSTRIQIDKEKYSELAELEISKISNIEVIREKVLNISKNKDIFTIKTDCSTWNSKKIIVTVGTFLNGKMHTGEEVSYGGRVECESSSSISDIFSDIKKVSQRFKTGTPARLDKNSIDYSRLEEQPSDSSVECFHYSHRPSFRNLEQKSCFLARTTPETMKIIRDNKSKSPMFNGSIKAVGARYCPSIEDKAYRYPDKDNHHIFIEPEGLNLDTMYPSGISTSLPREIQEEFMKTIDGLKTCKILVHGYAVEYDVIDTTMLNYSLEYTEISGLHFAGQINGTSGYEEAAGQGLIAGLNASLNLLNRPAIRLKRNDSYIGVMIEDLISNLRDEPYRLFTARSENRLYIREDNAILRINKYRKQFGLNNDIDIYQESYVGLYNVILDLVNSSYLSPDNQFLIKNSIKIKKRMSLSEVLKQNNLDPIETLELFLSFINLNVPRRTIRSVAISNKYSGYIAKSDEHMLRLNKLESKNINWKELCASENISFECKQRIEKIKPETFGQLKLIEGIRPATLAAVAGTYA